MLSGSPLLPDGTLQVMNGSNSSSQGQTSHLLTLGSVMGGMRSGVGGMMGTVGGMDVGCKFLYDGSTPSDEGPRPMFVLDAHHTLVVVRLAADMEAHQPALEVLLKLTRRTGIRDGGIAYIAWRRNRSKVESSIVCTSGNTESNRSNGSNENGVVTDRADVEKQETDIVNDVANDNLTVQQLEGGARFSYMGGRGGVLWRRLTYSLGGTGASGAVQIEDASSDEKEHFLEDGFLNYLNKVMALFQPHGCQDYKLKSCNSYFIKKVPLGEDLLRALRKKSLECTLDCVFYSMLTYKQPS